MLEGLIFDLDGCLIDSKDVQKAALFGSYHIVVGDDKCPTYEDYIKHTGDSVDNVFKKMGLPAEMAEHYRRISSEAVDKININWEAIDLIRDLKKEGIKIAICTGKDHYRVVDILEFYNISDLFDALVCADDVSNPKPSPEPIKAALKAINVENDKAVVVGDGYNDIVSAKNAGVRSVLALWYGDEGVPLESKYVARSVKELREIINGC